MMSIGVLTTSYPRFEGDQAGIFIKRLVDGLARRGIRGTVVVPLDKREPELENGAAFTVCRYRYGLLRKGSLAFGSGIMPNLRRNPTLIFQVPSLLKKMAATAKTLPHVGLLHAHWLSAGAAAWLAYKENKIPYIVTVRGEDIALLRNRFTKKFFHQVLRDAVSVTTVSEAFRAELSVTCELPAEKLFHIPNGVEVPAVSSETKQAFCERHKLEVTQNYVVTVSRLIPLKRTELLIQAFASPLLNSRQLVICGHGDKKYIRELTQLAATLGISDRVHFLGQIEPSNIPAALSIAKCFVSASSHEGRSNALLEALAAGVPSVVSNIPGHAELINNGINGLLFEGVDPVNIAMLIKCVLEDSELQGEMSREARLSVAHLSWDATATAYALLYEAAMERE